MQSLVDDVEKDGVGEGLELICMNIRIHTKFFQKASQGGYIHKPSGHGSKQRG